MVVAATAASLGALPAHPAPVLCLSPHLPPTHPKRGSIPDEKIEVCFALNNQVVGTSFETSVLISKPHLNPDL